MATRWLVLLLCASVVLGCKKRKPPTEPSDPSDPSDDDPALLSVGSPTKDEDPSPLRARDGSLLVAWFSDRGSNPGDIYVARSTTSGASWSTPVRVTSAPGGDFYPSLIQGADGTFHLVWFQWTAFQVGQIRYSRSTDGISWTPDEPVTADVQVDDWLPAIVEGPEGTLFVYFVAPKRNPNRNADIWVATRPPGATAWTAPVKPTGLNSAAEHDQLPSVIRMGTSLIMAWVRHDTTNADFITNPKSSIWMANSFNGLIWSGANEITRDPGNVVNLFPQLYQHADGAWYLQWLSTRSGGTPRVWEVPYAVPGSTPVQITQLPAGYSHRLVATGRPGEYLGVWVQGPTGSQDIYYRLFQR